MAPEVEAWKSSVGLTPAAIAAESCTSLAASVSLASIINWVAVADAQLIIAAAG